MTILGQVAKLGAGSLSEPTLREHVWPLFSRVLARKEIYLANHSLGRPLDRMDDDVREALGLWYEKMDAAWEDDGWPAEIERFRSSIAQLIGLSDPKSVVPKTSAGQGLRAVLNSLPTDRIRVVATRGEFDSVDFILKTYSARGRAAVRWVEPRRGEDGVPLFRGRDVVDAIDEETDLVVVSLIFFTTGQILRDVELIIEAAGKVGAHVLVDVYHAVGVIPVDIMKLGCDFMIGGSYKYTRGGPGACWLALHPRVLVRDLKTLDTGWFAKRDPFRYLRPDEPETAEGGDAWLESTPPILTMYQARSGLEFTKAIGVDRLREYSLGQLDFLRESFRRVGVPFHSPADPSDFGAFALLRHARAREVCRALLHQGVNTDSRGGFVRFGPDLLNSRDDLAKAAERTATVLTREG